MNTIDDIAAYLHDACDHVGHPEVYRALAKAAILHAEKNKGYRSHTDALANFRDSSVVAKGYLRPDQYAMTLCSKQDDALVSLLFSRSDKEYRERGGSAMLYERALDGIVYRALLWPLHMLGMAPGSVIHTDRPLEQYKPGSISITR
jgi:hypothetical protein